MDRIGGHRNVGEIETESAAVAAQAVFRLPPVIWHSRNKLAYLIYGVPLAVLYQAVNWWPVVEPRGLPMTWLDQVIPFVPALLPVYLVYLPLYWWTAARQRNDRDLNRIIYGVYFQLLLCLPFFVLFPVRMPRELFYRPEQYPWVDFFWRWFDAPNNCFPSLHVANCLLFVQFNWALPRRGLYAFAFVAIIASTVLVKQHYVADLAAGAVVYLTCRWFLDRLEVTGLSADGWDLRRLTIPRAVG